MVEIKPFLHGVTETPELDRFYAPVGPLIAKTQAAQHFGAKETWFLTVWIMAICSPGDTIILLGNAM